MWWKMLMLELTQRRARECRLWELGLQLDMRLLFPGLGWHRDRSLNASYQSHRRMEEDQLRLLLDQGGRGLLAGRGAYRVHGGGFAGTIQAYVPLDFVPAFKAGMEALLGEGMCHVVSIRPVGGVHLAESD